MVQQEHGFLLESILEMGREDIPALRVQARGICVQGREMIKCLAALFLTETNEPATQPQTGKGTVEVHFVQLINVS